MDTSEIIISGGNSAIEYFKEFEIKHKENAFIEERKQLDGMEIAELVITNLPAIINSVTSLIKQLKEKGVKIEIKKDGKKVNNI